MIKAHLSCPQELVFQGNLLLNKPTLPGQSANKKPTSFIEVSLIEMRGSKALVLLPNLLATKENPTAIVDIKYLQY